MVPFSVALLSVGTLLAQAVSEYFRRANSDDGAHPLQHKAFVTRNGGPVVFAFMFARTLGCAALVGLSVPNAVSDIQNLGVYETWTANVHVFILPTNVSGLLPIVLEKLLTSGSCGPSFLRFVLLPADAGGNG